MKDEIKEITLKDLLPNEFYINKNKQMVAEITIEKLNIIADILTNLQEEIERLNNIIDELSKWLIVKSKDYYKYTKYDEVLDKLNELKEGK